MFMCIYMAMYVFMRVWMHVTCIQALSAEFMVHMNSLLTGKMHEFACLCVYLRVSCMYAVVYVCSRIFIYM